MTQVVFCQQFATIVQSAIRVGILGKFGSLAELLNRSDRDRLGRQPGKIPFRSDLHLGDFALANAFEPP